MEIVSCCGEGPTQAMEARLQADAAQKVSQVHLYLNLADSFSLCFSLSHSIHYTLSASSSPSPTSLARTHLHAVLAVLLNTRCHKARYPNKARKARAPN